MKKNTTRVLLVGAIALVLYNLIVFMIPFERESAVFWLSYAFTMLAFGVLAVAVYNGFLKNPTAKSTFYTFPMVRIGLNYAAIQLIAGILVMAVGQWLAWWLVTLVYAIGLGVTVVMLISVDATVEQIKTMDGQLQARTSRMRALQSKVIHMESQCADADAAKAVKNLAEELRYSDPVSGPAVAEAENELSAVIDALQETVADGEAAVIVQLCGKASALLAERNRLCKLSK